MHPTWTGGRAQQLYPQQTGYPQQQQQQQYAQYTGQQQQQQPLMPQYTSYMQPPPMQMQMQQQPMPMPMQQPQLGAFQSVPSFFTNTFMPAQVMASSNANLPALFQQQSQQVLGQSTVQVQWALTEDERKSYRTIFRQWSDANGYISGARCQEVFKESGLDRGDLMKIW